MKNTEQDSYTNIRDQTTGLVNQSKYSPTPGWWIGILKQYHYDWSDYKEYFDANNDVNDVEATSLTTPSDEMLYRDARPQERALLLGFMYIWSLLNQLNRS